MDIFRFRGRSPRDRGRVSLINLSLLEFVDNLRPLGQELLIGPNGPLVLPNVNHPVPLLNEADDFWMGFEADDPGA